MARWAFSYIPMCRAALQPVASLTWLTKYIKIYTWLLDLWYVLSLLPPSQPPVVTDHLHQLLVGMIEDSSDQRSSLDHIASLSQQCSGQAEMEHVDRLVTYVLGSSHEVSSTSVAVSTSQLLCLAAHSIIMWLQEYTQYSIFYSCRLMTAVMWMMLT